METRKKKWEVFPGNNQFFCDGRLMISDKMGFWFISVFIYAIIIVSFLFE